MAFPTEWSYRKSITLSRASGAVTNYQMKVLVGESSGATGEAVDCGSLCKTDFSDLRFTNAAGTLLDYYIEDVSGATPNQLATIWVEFDSIGTGATTFYMYYGNAAATAVSDGPNTFVLFDDFNALTNGDIVGQNGWVSGGAGSGDMHVATTTKYEGAKALESQNGATNVSVKKTVPGSSYNYYLQARMRSTNISPGNTNDIYLREAGGQVTGFSIDTSKITVLVTPAAWTASGFVPTNSTWHKVGLGIVDTTHHSGVTIDGTLYSPANDHNLATISTKIDEIMLEHYAGTSVCHWDQILLMKWYPTGPAWGAWGAQEALGSIIVPVMFSQYRRRWAA